MKCKNHVTDPSCIVGVCASCVRERLLSVISAQEEADSQSVYQSYCNSNSVTNSTLRRSVSPYVNRQKSINSVNPVPIVQRPYNKLRLNSQSDKRFYSSPQIALNTGGCIGGTSNSSSRKKLSLLRFSSISNIFRSNSRKGDTDSKFSNHRVSVSSSNGQNSAVRNQHCVSDRGMSPVRSSSDGDEEDEFSDGSSVYESTESCTQTRKKQKPPSHHTFRRGGASLSNRILNVKGKTPVDGGFSGDARAPAAVVHICNARLFSPNRSRKLADFGRSDPSR